MDVDLHTFLHHGVGMQDMGQNGRPSDGRFGFSQHAFSQFFVPLQLSQAH